METSTSPKLNAVTGAFGYTGKYITRRLLEQGQQVMTLTNHPDRPDPFAGQVRAVPFSFEDPDQLTRSLVGVDTLYNTYWVRFNHGNNTFERAVANTITLFRTARQAGVRRVVHISITNPSESSPLPYFSGKAVLEKELQTLGIPYSILRPTVIFGKEDILINNIAYLLRRFPIFVIPGNGAYKLEPIFVEDLAALAVQEGSGAENKIINAVGPEACSFQDLVSILAQALNRRVALLHLPPGVALTLAQIVGVFTQDVVLTKDEVRGLVGGYLETGAVPAGATRFSEWVRMAAPFLGTEYHSELARHYRQ